MTTMDNTPAEDPTKEREVTITIKLGQEALDSYLDSGRKVLQGPHATKLQYLAMAMATILMDIRDEQFKLKSPTPPVDVPHDHRKADLRIAGRQAAIAITQLELALGIALKAAARVG